MLKYLKIFTLLTVISLNAQAQSKNELFGFGGRDSFPQGFSIKGVKSHF